MHERIFRKASRGGSGYFSLGRYQGIHASSSSIASTGSASCRAIRSSGRSRATCSLGSAPVSRGTGNRSAARISGASRPPSTASSTSPRPRTVCGAASRSVLTWSGATSATRTTSSRSQRAATACSASRAIIGCGGGTFRNRPTSASTLWPRTRTFCFASTTDNRLSDEPGLDRRKQRLDRYSSLQLFSGSRRGRRDAIRGNHAEPALAARSLSPATAVD